MPKIKKNFINELEQEKMKEVKKLIDKLETLV